MDESFTELQNIDTDTNWILDYWNIETKEIQGILYKKFVCKVVDNSGTPCDKTYTVNDEVIGNAVSHLINYHGFTQNGKVSKNSVYILKRYSVNYYIFRLILNNFFIAKNFQKTTNIRFS